jgi:hypothetical protein
MLIRVENDTLVRDVTTGAILETDKTKLERHRAIRSALKNKDQLIESMLERINKLESIIERIENGRTDT